VKNILVKLVVHSDMGEIINMITLKEVVGDRQRLTKFSHYIDGNMYYVVTVGESTYQFPINIFDKKDIGTTTILAEYRAITLMRYIRKAMETGDFIQIGK